MKILKIELQNINSLKSDETIVIDFQNEQFKDVGLYAITGATGAGKTTVLDAITIALYHNVPRFNGTKGTLVDVVSHGAQQAFTRLTFENDTIVYEAFWGIRVADKKGKKYKNPKEEVSLKNLTTDTILATQKRILLTEIIRVTQLDYNQFLRSVMLAQGEFASFLSAKGPEKGKLLEQITGEQIYKKIGQGILERKAFEENKLKEIQTKINADDVLTDEVKIELSEKNKVLDNTILHTEKEIKSIQYIVDWYISFKKLAKESDELDKDSKTIDSYIEKHKTELELLKKHEKAAPFAQLIQDHNRIEKEKETKANQLKNIARELEKLYPKIDSLEKIEKEQSIKVTAIDQEFAVWLPKFDIVTKLDSQLKNEVVNRQKNELQVAEIDKQIESLLKEKKQLAEVLTTTNSEINKTKAFVSDHAFLKLVDTEISNWTRDLTTLKANKQGLIKDIAFINKKNEEIEITNELLKKDRELLQKKVIDIDNQEKVFSEITVQLSKNNTTDLIAQKNKSILTESNWKQLKNIGEQSIKVRAERASKLIQKKELFTTLETLKKHIETLKKEQQTQTILVTDAVKILDLEKSISKYESDRKNLVAGIPCGLCGSKEHPFTKKLKEIDVSKSELLLNKREAQLKKINTSINESEKREVKLTTTIDGLTTQIHSISEELKEFKSISDKLDLACELTDMPVINAELNKASSQLKYLDERLVFSQQLQSNQTKLSEKLKIEKEVINKLTTTVAIHSEKLKNVKEEIEAKQKLIDNLQISCGHLETDLKTKLSKFNYQLPTIAATNIFIENIKTSIAKYAKMQTHLNNLEAETTVINTKLQNNKEQQIKLENSKSEYYKVIKDSVTLAEKLKTERVAILPITFTVENKRTSLQLEKKRLNDKVVVIQKELQSLIKLSTEQKTLKEKNEKEQKAIEITLTELNRSLDFKIKKSEFESKKNIENALLSNEEVLKYSTNKERIVKNQLQLETLKLANSKVMAALTQSRNFTTTEEESKTLLKELEVKRKELLTEKGKIVEAFRKDQEIKDRNKEVYKKIDAQVEVCKVWKELFQIIGNSKDAFNIYVQRLTLKNLLDLANVHLYKLNKRYSLIMEETYKPKEELNFNLIDHYQTDQVRLVDTSSGGEKFIISLALALGLSDLASKNVKIDSLFIDEGFGTLDKNTLETVISTLETLQSEGKMIGIISHVENLKERIQTQIQITKKSNGVSVVGIV